MHSCTVRHYFTVDEWANFHERLKSEGLEKDTDELICQWASYRGQTLYRTGLDCKFVMNTIFVARFEYIFQFQCIFQLFLFASERNDVLLASFDPSVLHRICGGHWLFLYLHTMFKFKF